MPKLNVMKVINENREKINTRYNLGVSGFNEILNNSVDSWDLIYNSFSIGYIQGMKAAKKEIKKGVK